MRKVRTIGIVIDDCPEVELDKVVEVLRQTYPAVPIILGTTDFKESQRKKVFVQENLCSCSLPTHVGSTGHVEMIKTGVTHYESGGHVFGID